MKITITAGDVSAAAELNESKTARAIWEALPLQASASSWGDEIYFSIPVEASEENGKTVVDLGELGYWPPGSALCIFFGPTPMSRGNEIRPASAVNPIGRITGDPTIFRKVRSGTPISITAAK